MDRLLPQTRSRRVYARAFWLICIWLGGLMVLLTQTAAASATDGVANRLYMPIAAHNQAEVSVHALSLEPSPVADPAAEKALGPRAALDAGSGNRPCTAAIQTQVELVSVYGQSLGVHTYNTQGRVVIQPPLQTKRGQQEPNPFSLLILSEPVINDPGEVMIVSATKVDELLFTYWRYTLDGATIQGQLTDNHTAEQIAQNLLTIPVEITPNLWMPYVLAMADVTTLQGDVSAKSVNLHISGNTTDMAHPFQIDITASGDCMPADMGSSPAVQVSPTSLDFGKQSIGTVSAARTVTLTNSSDTPLEIKSIGVGGGAAKDYLGASRTTCPKSGTLQPGQSCFTFIYFTPSMTGSRSAALIISSDDPDSPHQVTLTGAGTETAQPTGPILQINPTSLDFGKQNIGTVSAARIITLTNNGDLMLTFEISGESGGAIADYWGVSIVGTLQPGKSAFLPIYFTPSMTGSRSAALIISSDDPDSPHQVTLTGVGTEAAHPTGPILQINPTSLDFGKQNIGTVSAARTVTLTNSGDTELTLGAVSVSGDFVQIDNCETTLAAGTSCRIDVIFRPLKPGSHNGALRLTSNAAGSPHQVMLAGMGTAPTPPAAPVGVGTVRIQPRVGGSVVSADRRISVTISPAAAVQPMTVTIATADHLTVSVKHVMVGHAYTIRATDDTGKTITDLPKAATLVITYTDDAWQQAGVDKEADLTLYIWDGKQWTTLASCVGCAHDPKTNRVTVELTRLGSFALLAKESPKVYLPLLTRD